MAFLSFRTTVELRRKLEASARKNGRGLVQEVEARLKATLAND
jgi:hypothetical protein